MYDLNRLYVPIDLRLLLINRKTIRVTKEWYEGDDGDDDNDEDDGDNDNDGVTCETAAF